MEVEKLATSYALILGQMVKTLRTSNGLDQMDVANVLGTSNMTISRIESGETVLDVPQMEKLARFFKMDPVEFFQQSIRIKEVAERQNIYVLPSKKDIDRNAGLAILSVAALLAIVCLILKAKK